MPTKPLKPSSPLGRPPGSSALLSPELTGAICKALELAVPEKYAAESNGIAEETFHAWMRKGAAGVDESYVVFREAITRARAKAISNMHVRALSGGKGSSAALWMLERRWWREYAQHQRIEIAPRDEFEGMTESELADQLTKQRERVAEYERIRAEDEAAAGQRLA